jgi:hypothetical protein
MGGPGSGERRHTRHGVRECIPLDVCALRRGAVLAVRGGPVSLGWSVNNQAGNGSVVVLVEEDRVVVAEVRFPEGGRFCLGQALPIVRTPAGFTGTNVWWRCEGLDEPCGRRTRRVYLPLGRDRFACRRCLALVYISQRESDRRVNDFRADFGLLEAGLGSMDPQTAILAWKAWDLGPLKRGPRAGTWSREAVIRKRAAEYLSRRRRRAERLDAATA